MRLSSIIKDFRFLEEVRSKITLGTDVRLNPDTHYLQLKADATTGKYPLTADLYAKTWVAFPQAVKSWLGFEAEVVHTKIDTVQVTSVKFRLGNGTNEYYWTGAAWAVAGASDWNTESEIAANIGTFSLTARKIQVIINLKTTNATATPLVRAVKILYGADVEFLEDIVYRSLVPALRNNIRPKGRHIFAALTTTNTFDLTNDYPIDTPYNIPAIDSVYNHTDDPNHLTDLYSSWNSTTRVLTLSGSVAQGKDVWVNFLWEPEVAVTTSQDYSEVEKVPAIVLDDINLVDATEIGLGDGIVNRSDGTAVKLAPPLRGDLEIMAHLITDKGVDLQRLAGEMRRFFGNNPLLTSTALDEQYRLWQVDEFDMTTAANREDMHSGRLRFRVVGVLFLGAEPEDLYAVQALKLTGDLDVTIQ